MTVAYIAGPYRAAKEWRVVQNIRAAEQVALKYWALGYAVICPHKNTAMFGGFLPDGTWLTGDLEFVRRSDVVVMMRGWENSYGASAEHRLALELGKEVIYE